MSDAACSTETALVQTHGQMAIGTSVTGLMTKETGTAHVSGIQCSCADAVCMNPTQMSDAACSTETALVQTHGQMAIGTWVCGRIAKRLGTALVSANPFDQLLE